MIRAERLRGRPGRAGGELDASVAVARGEGLAIVATPASGVSALLRMIATLLAPASGRLEVAGIDAIANPLGVRAHLFWTGWPMLSSELTVDEYGRLARAGRRRAAHTWPHEALRAAGVAGHEPLDRLTLTQRRLVDIAAAVHSSADVLVLDEPLRALGAAARVTATGLLSDARAEGTTILMAAATSTDLPRLWDRLLGYDRGTLAPLATGLEGMGT